MHRPEIVRRVELLVASEALSLRGIAALVGISRGSVVTIRDGRHHHQRAGSSDPAADDEDRPLQRGPVGRCPTCGGLVEQPCRACHCRTMPRPIRAAVKAVQQGEIGPLGVELAGEARQRYERIYARKVEESRAGVDREGGREGERERGRRSSRRALRPAPSQLPLFDREPPPWELDDADQTEAA